MRSTSLRIQNDRREDAKSYNECRQIHYARRLVHVIPPLADGRTSTTMQNRGFLASRIAPFFAPNPTFGLDFREHANCDSCG